MWARRECGGNGYDCSGHVRMGGEIVAVREGYLIVNGVVTRGGKRVITCAVLFLFFFWKTCAVLGRGDHD